MKQISKEELRELVYDVSQKFTEKEMKRFSEEAQDIKEKEIFNTYLVEVLGILSVTNVRICNETIIEVLNTLNNE